MRVWLWSHIPNGAFAYGTARLRWRNGLTACLIWKATCSLTNIHGREICTLDFKVDNSLKPIGSFGLQRLMFIPSGEVSTRFHKNGFWNSGIVCPIFWKKIFYLQIEIAKKLNRARVETVWATHCSVMKTSTSHIHHHPATEHPWNVLSGLFEWPSLTFHLCRQPGLIKVTNTPLSYWSQHSENVPINQDKAGLTVLRSAQNSQCADCWLNLAHQNATGAERSLCVQSKWL